MLGENAKIKKVLIISFGNEYDVIHFTNIYKKLRDSKDTQLTLLIRTTARSLVPFIKNVHRVLFFDEKKLKNRIEDDTYSLVEKYHYLNDYFYSLKQEKFDLAVNLSHCTVSSKILQILSIKDKMGFSQDDYNNRNISGDWMQVFFASVNAENYNPFSFYNMFDAQFEVNSQEEPPEMDSDNSLDSFYKKIRKRFNVKGKELVLISCASKAEESKRWHLDSIIKLSNLLAKQGEKVVVIAGPEGETALRNVESYVDKAVPCEIMTALDFTLFMRYTKVVISQTMSAIAIPAALHVPIICISINEVNFREFFPSSEGSFIVNAVETEIEHGYICSLVDAINFWISK